jgi:hypothetical protein
LRQARAPLLSIENLSGLWMSMMQQYLNSLEVVEGIEFNKTY